MHSNTADETPCLDKEAFRCWVDGIAEGAKRTHSGKKGVRQDADEREGMWSELPIVLFIFPLSPSRTSAPHYSINPNCHLLPYHCHTIFFPLCCPNARVLCQSTRKKPPKACLYLIAIL